MKLRMDNFWNTFIIVALGTFAIHIFVSLILAGSPNFGGAANLGIILGVIVGALVKFKKLDFS